MTNYTELKSRAKQTLAAIEAAERGEKWEVKAPSGIFPWRSPTDCIQFYIENGWSLRPAPFDLASHLTASGFILRPGQRWHREDWTADMLPKGWRPLLLNEKIISGDEMLYDGVWISGSRVPSGGFCGIDHLKHRTQRPLPSVRRPWSKPEDVPGPVCWVRWKGSKDESLSIGIDERGVQYAGLDKPHYMPWNSMNKVEHSLDRRTWQPCEVED